MGERLFFSAFGSVEEKQMFVAERRKWEEEKFGENNNISIRMERDVFINSVRYYAFTNQLWWGLLRGVVVKFLKEMEETNLYGYGHLVHALCDGKVDTGMEKVADVVMRVLGTGENLGLMLFDGKKTYGHVSSYHIV